MILAAGLGTRLAPLTSTRPKPLVPVGNRPIIDRTIFWLKAHGVDEMVVNTHHHPSQIRNYLNSGRPFGVRIHISEEPEILGTGGGIRKTRWFWDREPFIVVNGGYPDGHRPWPGLGNPSETGRSGDPGAS